MKDFIVIAILMVILGLAAWYIIRSKKRGQKCIGCPNKCGCPEVNKCNGCKTED